MRPLFYGAVVLAGAAVLAATYIAGRRDGRSTAHREQLHRIGLTEGCARRYVQAVALLERLDGSRDKAGVLAGDTLSTDTYRMVTEWVGDHRKEFAD